MKFKYSSPLVIFIRNNLTNIKYIGLVFVFFSLLVMTRTYINYLSIQETIQNTNNEIYLQKKQIAYTENFLLNYYDSEYRDFFFRHKNRILNPGEKIVQIKIVSPKEEAKVEENINTDNQKEIITPNQSRNQFIKEKWEKI